MRDATVRASLPPLERATLENELRARAAYFRALEVAAAGEGNEYGYPEILHNVAYMHRRALGKLRNGLKIDYVQCKGSGPTVTRRQFRRFRCAAVSELLEIPSQTVLPAQGSELPTVIRHEPRTLGPFRAQLHVRVTGRSTIAYRQSG